MCVYMHLHICTQKMIFYRGLLSLGLTHCHQGQREQTVGPLGISSVKATTSLIKRYPPRAPHPTPDASRCMPSSLSSPHLQPSPRTAVRMVETCATELRWLLEALVQNDQSLRSLETTEVDVLTALQVWPEAKVSAGSTLSTHAASPYSASGRGNLWSSLACHCMAPISVALAKSLLLCLWLCASPLFL